MLSFTKKYPVTLYVTAGVGGCWCPISVKDMRMTYPCCQLENRDTNYSSITLTGAFFIVVHSICIEIFGGGGGGVLQ